MRMRFFNRVISYKKILAFSSLVVVFASSVVACHREQSLGVNSEGARRMIAAMALDDGDVNQTALYWIRDRNDHYQSFFVSGNKNGAQLLGSTRSLVLKTETDFYEINNSDEEVVLCDCEKWRAASFEDACPAALKTATMSRVLLSSPNKKVVSTRSEASTDGEETDGALDIFPLSFSEEELNQLVSLRQHSVITGSIGPYVFIRYEREYQLCRDETVYDAHGYSVFNLDAMQFEPVLSDAELEQVNDNEREDAFASVRGDTGFEHLTAADLELTEIHPEYVAGLGFSVAYEFEARSQMSEEKNNWRDYTKDIKVLAKQIPIRLTPFALAPPLVRNLRPRSDVRVGGWSVILAVSESDRETLEMIFKPADDAPNVSLPQTTVEQ
ncbi:MAG: hypothetical protein JXR76_24440 [Deltaproteobacteria bacterium]|nr:hypothetical protein [Deltaproteobacteria bacterium]